MTRVGQGATARISTSVDPTFASRNTVLAKETIVPELGERHVRIADKLTTYRGEAEATDAEHRSSWRPDDARHDQ